MDTTLFRALVPLLLAGASASNAAAQGSVAPPAAPQTRTYEVTQTVVLDEVPAGSKRVRMWLALPGDAPAQRVLDVNVASAPGAWRIVREAEHGNEFLYVEVENPKTAKLSTVIDVVVQRDPMHVELDPAKAGPITESHRRQFAEYLVKDAPNMTVDAKVQKLADDACGSDVNVVTQARKLFDSVADYADHYSKDPSKPKCGRGSVDDCLAAKGGCCTDLHSMFIALMRARGIPSRIQFGYRVQAKNEGKEVDPGYRCWVEYFVPGFGWTPTDIVAGDAGERSERDPYFSGLDERRLWCCTGREFQLEPRQDGPRVNTMIIGYAEIDGKPVPVLPDANGKPSPFTRSVRFVERKVETGAAPAGG